jgi:hypothetical protein
MDEGINNAWRECTAFLAPLNGRIEIESRILTTDLSALCISCVIAISNKCYCTPNPPVIRKTVGLTGTIVPKARD